MGPLLCGQSCQGCTEHPPTPPVMILPERRASGNAEAADPRGIFSDGPGAAGREQEGGRQRREEGDPPGSTVGNCQARRNWGLRVTPASVRRARRQHCHSPKWGTWKETHVKGRMWFSLGQAEFEVCGRNSEKRPVGSCTPSSGPESNPRGTTPPVPGGDPSLPGAETHRGPDGDVPAATGRREIPERTDKPPSGAWTGC